MLEPEKVIVIAFGDDLCFTHVYKNKPHIVKVTREALEHVLGAEASLQARTQTLRQNLPLIFGAVERKIDSGELPIVYRRDIARPDQS